MVRDAALGRKHVDELDGVVGECLDHDLRDGAMGKCVMGCATAIPDTTDAMFDDRSVLGDWMDNDGDVVFLHEFGEWFKFGVHMKVCDGEASGVAQCKGLVKAFTQ